MIKSIMITLISGTMAVICVKYLTAEVVQMMILAVLFRISFFQEEK